MSAVDWLERGGRLLRRLGAGRLVDRLGPSLGAAAARHEVVVDGFRLTGNHVGQLYYLREIAEGRDRTLVELAQRLTPAGGTAVEAGAHLGYLTCQLARAVRSGGQVWTFEPDPEVRPALVANLERNGLDDRVAVDPRALGAESGRARFYVSGGGEASSLFAADSARRVVDVDVVALDAALPDGPLVDLVKLDIEGAELAALRGMRRTLERSGDLVALLVELNPELLEAAGASAAELLDELAGFGFQVWRIDEHAGRLSDDARVVAGGYANLVCARGERAAALAAQLTVP